MLPDTLTLHARITALAETACRAHDLTLWGVEIAGARRLLVRVYLDAPGGVSIDQCEAVSKHLSLALDVEDPIPGAYTLEVSSPGLDRIFFHPQQLAQYTGSTVKVRLREPQAGRRNFQGTVEGVEGDTIRLREKDTLITIPWTACAKVQLVFHPAALLRGE